uniref:Uncharacterized protein n=1 Tax=Opuntia streptacantha TaxID=393608 RepID=A0A7C8YJ88_OPUST
MSNAEANMECVSCQDEEWAAEERMDYLWEDFNHEEEKRESKRICSSKEVCIVKKQGSNKMGRSHHRSSSRTSILVMGKLLKGLLSIKKSAQTKIMKARF